MKQFLRILSLLLLIVGISNNAYSQYYYNDYPNPGENPKNLNQDDENPGVSGWTTILAAKTNTWTSNQSIPFSFDFNGSSVSSYKVSPSGVLTFSTSATTVPSSANVALPSTNIPDKSVCIWGLSNSGSNDVISKKTFGVTPNRQHWIYFVSYSSPQSTGQNWTYWGIVLEESTNNIYLVDMRTFQTPLSLTLGVQINDSVAYQVQGSPNITSLANNGGTASTSADNAYYEFIYGTLPNIDLTVSEIEIPKFPNLSSAPFNIQGKIENKGADTIQSFTINYSINNGSPVSSQIQNINLLPRSSYNFLSGKSWTPASSGKFEINVWASNINGQADEKTSNDTLGKEIVVSDTIPNIIDNLLNGSLDTLIGDLSDQLDDPKDLEFHPNLNKKELWVVNQKIEATGGSTVTFYEPGEPNQSSLSRQDGNAWHFMSLPVGIAFSENGNFATAPSVYNANHNNGVPFTGPALWSSDSAIYARPSGGNGSHLDMLHASPYSMGIAAEKENVFWVFDGNSNDIVRYDFVDDHGPGNDYHADGKIRRFPVPVKRINGEIPCHLILDKDSDWLYIVDNGNKRVLRLDITSGSLGGTPTFGPFEPLAEYKNMTGIKWEVYIDSGLVQPSGIEIIGDRLLVGDYSSGDIRIYDLAANATSYLGKIKTNASGLTGLTVGPKGNVWYVNGLNNELRKIKPLSTALSENGLNAAALTIYPNPSNGQINLQYEGVNLNEFQIEVKNLMGQIVFETKIEGSEKSFNLSNLSNGVYFLTLSNGEQKLTKRIIIN